MNSIYNRLSECDFCPRKCKVNRLDGQLGFCNVDARPLVASIVAHKGEEPVISGKLGICNVFFAHCNLSCVYCQNSQISQCNYTSNLWYREYNKIVDKIIEILDQGITLLGFVSPTHQTYQMIEIINRVKEKGYNPRVVYNSNGYDNPKILRELSDIIDIYLPDFKYSSNRLAHHYSNVSDYSLHAIASIKEMVWQKGTSPIIDDNGIIESGVIVRHLILPGHTNDSKLVLKILAYEISNNLTISLMSQYTPPKNLCFSKINRGLSQKEYDSVIETMKELGFHRGWTQDLSSINHYTPNFSEKNPFFS